MKLSWEILGIETRGKTSGQIKTFCPKCRNDRKSKNRTDTPLSVDLDKGVFNCHNCSNKGSIYISENKDYLRPKQNVTNLSEKTKDWFLKRGIEESTLQYFKITESVEWMPDGEYNEKVVPAAKRNTINFNYFRDGELINIKYRDSLKSFRMVSNAEMIFYNIDAIKGKNECAIVEGEIDCMAMYQAGYFYSISVPNGASKSGNAKLAYLDNCWELFEDKEKIYIAVDNDEAGISLRTELIRRLGADRCFVVTFDECKDANEYLIMHGASRLLQRIKNAEPVPTKGIWKIENFKDKYFNLFNYGREKPATVHLGEFDDHVSFRKGDFSIVTGIPSHGKSQFVLYLQVLLSSFYGWKWVIFSPENMPEEELSGMIASAFIGQSFDSEKPEFKMTSENAQLAYQFINEHFYFFKFDEADISIAGICQTIKECVKKHGVNGAVIDPFTCVEHSEEKDSETLNIKDMLNKFSSLSDMFGIHLFLVAHPTKLKKDINTKQYEVPNLYSISGSAHFHNFCDVGLIVYRNNDNSVDIYIEKVRRKFVGSPGMVKFNFHYFTGRYGEFGKDYILPYRHWLELKQDGVVNSIDFSNPTKLTSQLIEEEKTPWD